MAGPSYILGLSAYYHDSAAALLKDGEILAAAQEERFSRRKHDPSFPLQAAHYCLGEAGIDISDVAHIVFYDKPFSKFGRLLETCIAVAPLGIASYLKSMPVWLGSKLWIEADIAKALDHSGDILYCEHHESHAASAFYPSPFQNATVICLDGVGEWTTSSISVGDGRDLRTLAELRFPHSLGLLYSAFTYYTGFKVNSGEYKMMGLAPYGQPVYASRILDELVDLRADGSFRLNLSHFNFHKGLTMTNRTFHRLFGGPPRDPEGALTQRDMDIASSIQHVTEEIVTRIARHWVGETGFRNVCLAGGVALNCVANGKLFRSGLIDDLWIQPAAGDAGGALGAALAIWHRHLGKDRRVHSGDAQKGSYLGPATTAEEAKAYFDEVGAEYEQVGTASVPARAAELIAEGHVVGWFQGRMEFGPRALGARSILGDPRSLDIQRTMNLKIKYRESFRPFAPAVLVEHVEEYFEHAGPSPYMLLVADVQPRHRSQLADEDEQRVGLDKLAVARSDIPAVTHVDCSARVQTVDGRWNPVFRALLAAIGELTGVPMVVNTSFNVRGEPIVCTVEHAYRCFMRTEMDYLVVEDLLLDKSRQPPFTSDVDWQAEFSRD